METISGYRLSVILLVLSTSVVLSQSYNNLLRGRVLYLSSGNKFVAGVHVQEEDSNGDYSNENGEYQLIFQTKRNGSALFIKIGDENKRGDKIELVNEKEIKSAIIPDDISNVLDIIVCLKGLRDIAAQKYYNILKTKADSGLNKIKDEVKNLLSQREVDYKRIDSLTKRILYIESSLDSVKLKGKAFYIASINTDRASDLIKNAIEKMDENNDIDESIKILDNEVLDTAYIIANNAKILAVKEIQKVIEAYRLKISLLEAQYRYSEMAECAERLVYFYKEQNYSKNELADIIYDAASYWDEAGYYKKAISLHMEALRIRENTLVKNHPLIAVSNEQVSINYLHLGDAQKAQEFNSKAIKIIEKSHIRSDKILSELYNHQARINDFLGEYNSQLKFNLKALSLQEKIFNKEDPKLLNSYMEIGLCYINLGDNEKALNFISKATIGEESKLGADHPTLTTNYNNLANVYANLGKFDSAVYYHLKTISIAEKILPSNHPTLGVYYNSTGYTYGRHGKYKKAAEMYKKALAIQEGDSTIDKVKLATTYSNFALIYQETSNFEKALEYNLKALKLLKEALAPNHPFLGACYNNISLTYCELGEFKKALAYNKDAIKIGMNTLPHNHPDLVVSYNNLGDIYQHLGDYKNSIKWCKKAIKFAEESATKNIFLNRFYYTIGLTYIYLKDFPKAKEALAKSEEIKYEDGILLAWCEYYGAQNDSLKTLEYFNKAINRGFNDLEWITTNAYLKCIRDSNDYSKAIEKINELK